MKYCIRCVMPDTRPGIKFNENGVCSSCQSFENRKNIDWNERYKELVNLCDKYRGINGSSFDCAIAVSGGKDSHYQVHLMKNVFKMNPILFTVEDNFKMTEAGKHNIRNISEEFGCPIISLKPDIKTQKILMKYTFEKYGKPTWFIDRLIYTFPMLMALKFNTSLLVYGENVSYEYGGSDGVETYSAINQLSNGVASDIDINEFLQLEGISHQVLELTKAPTSEDIKKLDPIYISYFIPWNSYSNYLLAKNKGFKDLAHEWDRSHHAENFDQIDSRAYLVHSWMKYPKFGHASATDYASRFVRYGIMSRNEAIEVVKKQDHDLDSLCVNDFTEFLGYSQSEFWNIIDKFYNRDLFVKDQFGKWILRTPVWL